MSKPFRALASVIPSSSVVVPSEDGPYTVQEWSGETGSVGVIELADAAFDGAGNIVLGAGYGLIRKVDDDKETLYRVDWSSETLPLTDDTEYYVYIEWTDATYTAVHYELRTTELTQAQNRIFALALFREGTGGYLALYPHTQLGDGLRRLATGLTLGFVYWPEDNQYARIANPGTLHLVMSAGKWRAPQHAFNTSARNTAGTDRFDAYWQPAVSTNPWNEDSGRATFDPDHYDNGSGTLAHIGGGEYGVHWVFLGTDDVVHVLYGRASYATLAAAQAAARPGTQPNFFQYRARLLGRVITQQGSAVMAANPENAFDATFGASGAATHETLPDLQGGAPGVHIHLTAAELTKLQDAGLTSLLAADTGLGIVYPSAAATWTRLAIAGIGDAGKVPKVNAAGTGLDFWTPGSAALADTGDFQAVDAGLTSLLLADAVAGLPYVTAANTWATATLGGDLQVSGGAWIVADLHLGSDARGDLAVRDAANWNRLAVGTVGYVLLSNGTDPGWGQVGVPGMVASATDVLFGRSSAGGGTAEEIACTAAGRALLDDANATAQRSTLGLGSAAVEAAGAFAASGLATASGLTVSGPTNVLGRKGVGVGAVEELTVAIGGDVAPGAADQAAGTASLRTLGTTATSAAAGNHGHSGVYAPVGDFASTGITGTASRLAGFTALGVATFYQVGADVQAYDAGLFSLTSADGAAGLPWVSGANVWTALSPVAGALVVWSAASVLATVAPSTSGLPLKAGGAGNPPTYGNITQAVSHDSSDTDGSASALHHTIGTGATQAAAGNHAHTGTYQPASANLTTLAGVTPGTAGLAVLDDATVADIRTTISTVSRNFGPLNADPSPTPAAADGDTYFNTALGMLMAYDATRAKWLSVATWEMLVEASGNTNANAYFTTGGLAMSATSGRYMPWNGTITSGGYTRSDSDAVTFEVYASGVATGAEITSSATSGSKLDLNSNFSAGAILALRNKNGGNTVSNVRMTIRGRWRA